MNIEIKQISVIDDNLFDRLNFIEQACFDEHSAFSKEDFPDIVRRSGTRCGAYDDGVLIGYALARYGFGVGYLYSNAVLPEYRNKGIGSSLLSVRCERLMDLGCKTIQAHTKLDNKASASLLRKASFIPIQYVTDFYDDNIDAILWSKTL